ncbi:MAG: Rrf2 family transcriptional regulator [bacterium]
MKIPSKVHYAIVILIDIARQSKGATVTGNEIARRQNISFSSVAQLLNKLKHAGMLESVRGGVTGGYHFKGVPSEISVKKIIEAIDPGFCLCPGTEIKTDKEVDDTVRSFWQELEAEMETRLEITTVEELARRTANSKK